MEQNLVFMGSGEFGAGCLKGLVENGHEPVAVITQKSKPCGRGRKVKSTHVKSMAEKMGLNVLEVRSVNKGDGWNKLSEFKPDVIVVADFGQILSQRVLDLPPLGCFNVHPSLLPRYRGAAPIQRTLENGETETGVSIFKIVKELDAGPIALQKKIRVDYDDNFASLFKKLLDLAVDLLCEFMEKLKEGRVKLIPQDEKLATYAPKVEPHDLLIRWTEPAEKVRNKIRAYDPKPGAYSYLDGERVKLFEVREVEKVAGEAGNIVKIEKKGMLVTTGEGGVWISKIQFPGKRVVHVWDAYIGRRLKEGGKFDVHCHQNGR